MNPVLTFLIGGGLATVALAQQTYDAFDGTALDPARWYQEDLWGISVSNGALHMAYPGYWSSSVHATHGFVGDYEVVVPFSNRTGQGSFGLTVRDADALGPTSEIQIRLLTSIQAWPIQDAIAHISYEDATGTVTVAQNSLRLPIALSAGELRVRRGTNPGNPTTWTIVADFRAAGATIWTPLVSTMFDATSPLNTELVVPRLDIVTTRHPGGIDFDQVTFVGTLLANSPAAYGDRCDTVGLRAGFPRLGRPFVFDLFRSDFGFLALGLGRTSWAHGALPYDLTALGAPGCWLLTSSDTSFVAQGIQFAVPVPNDANLLGVQLFAQAAADPSNGYHNPLGWSFSNGIDFTILP